MAQPCIGAGSFNGLLVERPVEAAGVEGIHQDFGIDFPHVGDHVREFVGRNHGLADVILPSGVGTGGVNDGHAVAADGEKRIGDLVGVGGGELHGDLGVALVEGGYRFGGEELEEDGISGGEPAEGESIEHVHDTVGVEDILEYALVQFRADVLGDKVCSAGASPGAQCQGNGEAPADAAEEEFSTLSSTRGVNVKISRKTETRVNCMAVSMTKRLEMRL